MHKTLTRAEVRRLLPERPDNSHKGANGRALLLVGSETYTGAALLSSAAALRAGCGILTAAVPGRIKPAFSALPEACCTPVSDGGTWDRTANRNAAALLQNRQAIGIGCGMDYTDDTSLIEAALYTGTPIVIDADALNLISREKFLLTALHRRTVLTPHPGEMARLTGKTVGDITADPEKAATEAAARWNCVVLLKGAVSYIASPERLIVNETGNSGLAKGGSGDVLTGLIVGLLAQGMAPFDAACVGAYLLGTSADDAFDLLGKRMLMATDVIDAVAGTLNRLSD